MLRTLGPAPSDPAPAPTLSITLGDTVMPVIAACVA